ALAQQEAVLVAGQGTGVVIGAPARARQQVVAFLRGAFGAAQLPQGTDQAEPGPGLPGPVAVTAEDPQALLEVRQGLPRLPEGEVGPADVAVGRVPQDDRADGVPDGQGTPVLFDGGTRIGVRVQVAEVAVGDGLAVGVVQLPRVGEALPQCGTGLRVPAERLQQQPPVVEAPPDPGHGAEPPPDAQRAVGEAAGAVAPAGQEAHPGEAPQGVGEGRVVPEPAGHAQGGAAEGLRLGDPAAAQ